MNPVPNVVNVPVLFLVRKYLQSGLKIGLKNKMYGYWIIISKNGKYLIL